MSTLSAPVGKKRAGEIGVNRPEDVRLVKRLLNRHFRRLGLSRLLDEASGECDAQTVAAIRVFQERVLKLRWTGGGQVHTSRAFDARVEPNDETFLALSHRDVPAFDHASKRPGLDRPRSGLVLVQKHNQPGRSDATGAFHIGAKRFAGLYGLSLRYIDNSDTSRAGHASRCRATYAEIDKLAAPVDVIALFGHGTPDGLPSFGVYSADVGRLAERLRRVLKPRATVLLYACSAGAFGGFADQLASAINSGGSTTKDCRVVYGHLIDGHSYTNPYCSYFPGREYVVTPGSDMFGSWQRGLSKTDLWAEFPFLSDPDLFKRLSRVYGAGDYEPTPVGHGVLA
jgi:hypothetical protein